MSRATPALKAARRCYGHLAGEAGIALREILEAAGYLRLQGSAYRLTEAGRRWAEALGLDTDDRDPAKHARACLDWTERQPHIGGRLGRGLLDRLIEEEALTAGDGRALEHSTTLETLSESVFRKVLRLHACSAEPGAPAPQCAMGRNA